MENINHSDNGTFVVKKNKKISILAFAGCFLLAFIIWTYVINVKISDNSKTFTIKMDTRGEQELLEEKNYCVFGGSETWVKVTVQGTNADLNKISEKDLGVYIDVSDIDKAGVATPNIVVECKNTAVSVKADLAQARIFVDEKIKSSVSIKLDENQTNISNVISVEGPKTDVEQIHHAKVVMAKANKNLFEIIFYDSHDNIVESPYLVYNASEIIVSTDEQ